MDLPLSREEKRKNKKKERKRQQRRLIAISQQKLVDDSEMDNAKDGEMEKKEIEQRKDTITINETECCECDSRDIRYRCDNCKKVYCEKVEKGWLFNLVL